jgi:Rod binding domain-containing protein
MVAPLATPAVSAAAKLAGRAVGHAAGGVDAAAQREARARKTAQDYESMFLEQSLERMFATTGGEGPLGDGGAGAEVYRSMLVKEYAGSIAKSGGVGIADQIYREIIKLQEGGNAKHV